MAIDNKKIGIVTFIFLLLVVSSFGYNLVLTAQKKKAIMGEWEASNSLSLVEKAKVRKGLLSLWENDALDDSVTLETIQNKINKVYSDNGVTRPGNIFKTRNLLILAAIVAIVLGIIYYNQIKKTLSSIINSLIKKLRKMENSIENILEEIKENIIEAEKNYKEVEELKKREIADIKDKAEYGGIDKIKEHIIRIQKWDKKCEKLERTTFKISEKAKISLGESEKTYSEWKKDLNSFNRKYISGNVEKEFKELEAKIKAGESNLRGEEAELLTILRITTEIAHKLGYYKKEKISNQRDNIEKELAGLQKITKGINKDKNELIKDGISEVYSAAEEINRDLPQLKELYESLKNHIARLIANLENTKGLIERVLTPEEIKKSRVKDIKGEIISAIKTKDGNKKQTLIRELLELEKDKKAAIIELRATFENAGYNKKDAKELAEELVGEQIPPTDVLQPRFA